MELIEEGPPLRTKGNHNIYPQSNHVMLHHNMYTVMLQIPLEVV